MCTHYQPLEVYISNLITIICSCFVVNGNVHFKRRFVVGGNAHFKRPIVFAHDLMVIVHVHPQQTTTNDGDDANDGNNR